MEVNDEGDNPPIGIILCTDKNSADAEYALGGMTNTIFASRYTYIIPDKEELIAQVEAVMKEMEFTNGDETATILGQCFPSDKHKTENNTK